MVAEKDRQQVELSAALHASCIEDKENDDFYRFY